MKVQTHLITRTKVILPQRRADLLTRPRLLDLLADQCDNRLVTISAPAGYGKTSLLLDFAHSTDQPVCWYTLDELDSDVHRFTAHLIASLSERFPAFGEKTATALETSQELDTERLASILSNEMVEQIHEYFLLILDDYHLIADESEIDQFVGRLIRVLPEHCHLIISSRNLVALPNLALLVARSQAGGLGQEELAFRSEEIQSLIFQKYRISIPDDAANELWAETEGWITGLLLSAQTIWPGMVSQVRAARLAGVDIHNYLALQVLELQPDPIQDFLMRTSFFEEFDAELCQALWGSSKDWHKLMEFLRQGNLFVLTVGSDGKWLRYHHLFRDFLRAHFKQTHPEEVRPLLEKLVDVYAMQDEWEQAYATCAGLNDPARLADLIEKAGPSLLKYGRAKTLGEWIGRVPERIVEARPGLLSLNGIAAVLNGRNEAGLEWLDRAAATQLAQADWPGLALTLVRRTYAYRFKGQYPSALKDAEEALRLSERYRLPHLRAEALRTIGSNLHQMGRLDEAIQTLQSALSAYQEIEDIPNLANTRLDLGFGYMAAGHYQMAVEQYQQVLEYWRQIDNFRGLANLLNNLGSMYQLTGAYEQAIDCFDDGLVYALRVGSTRMGAYLYCGIGDVYADLQAFEEADLAYGKAQDIAERVNDRFLIFYLTLAKAEQARLQGNFSTARKLFVLARSLVEKSTSRSEQGLCRLEDGRLALAEGHLDDAEGLLSEAALRFEEGGQEKEAAIAHFYRAIAFQAAGDFPSAVEALLRSFQLSTHPDSRHVLVVAGQEARLLLELAMNFPEVASRSKDLQERIDQFKHHLPALRRRVRSQAAAVPFAPPKLSIHALGKSQVDLGGKPVSVPEWANQKRVRELFFYILSRPRGVTRDDICLTFWPDSSPAQLKLQFKNALYRLRYSIGQDAILLDNNHYWFNQSLDYEYDVELFRAKLAQAQAAESVQAKISAYRAAVELYTGAYFPECEGSWGLSERENLSRLYLQALSALARLYQEAHSPYETLEMCQRMIAEDPCQEEGYRLAMQAYFDLGNQAEISRQYELCRMILQEEIATEPSKQTQDLYRKLRPE